MIFLVINSNKFTLKMYLPKLGNSKKTLIQLKIGLNFVILILWI